MMRTSTLRRKGNVVVIVTICLVALLSVISLSLDGGVILDKRRQAQATADAAALAGANEMYVNSATHLGLDNGPIVPPASTGPAPGAIKAHVKLVAKENGYEDGKNGVTVTVNIPPTSGPNRNKAYYVEVIISAPQKRGFSAVFGSKADVTYGARSVAYGKLEIFKNGVLVLDPAASPALKTNGGGTATITGLAPTIVNSSASDALSTVGGGSISSQSGYNITGGYNGTAGGSIMGNPLTLGTAPTPDPLRFLPAPPRPAVAGTETHQGKSGKITLTPGYFTQALSFSGTSDVTMAPGIYYLEKGLTVTGQANLTGIGVTIYNAPTANNHNINLAGTGRVILSPPETGTYKGITIFQQRTGIQPEVQVTGNGNWVIDGTFYVPSGPLKTNGNGDISIGGQYISDTLVVGGGGNFTVRYQDRFAPGYRDIWLAE